MTYSIYEKGIVEGWEVREEWEVNYDILKFLISEIREYCSINIKSLKEFCHSNSFSTKPGISFTRPWYFYYHNGTFRTRPWYEKMKTDEITLLWEIVIRKVVIKGERLVVAELSIDCLDPFLLSGGQIFFSPIVTVICAVTTKILLYLIT